MKQIEELIAKRLEELRAAKEYTDDLNARLRAGETITMTIGGYVSEGEIEFLGRLEATLAAQSAPAVEELIAKWPRMEKHGKTWVPLAEVEAALRQLAPAPQTSDRAMRILESLTVGGSEFVGDPDACAAYIHKKISTLHNIAKRATLRANQARALAAQPAQAQGWEDHVAEKLAPAPQASERERVQAILMKVRGAITLTDEVVAEFSQSRVDALEPLRGVESIVEFYLKREIEAPANHQEAAREAADKLRKFRTAIRALAAQPDATKGG